ncbi:alpha/beta hydrolase [Mycobacterium celatum]|uniref:Alpha/beta hydrolase n=1 Tax=Mycobacterium celatum TaxID=28045 RepID=A0A1X1RMW0_MYCCE|nr:alpha/beta fold hydrolase [Mycobacterium celatum]ORV09961.1 alpha/beta hydrolase [Mycobacterium celatum]
MNDGDDACADEGSGLEPPVSPRVRRAFGILERFAPRLGARWAIELWCSPPEPKSTRMPPGVGPGEPIRAWWSGHRVTGEAWGEGPPVYLVHGWGGCRAHLGVFVKPLVAAGHRVVAFDLPSHHESGPGELAPGRTTIAECARAVQAMVDTHGPARAIIAHSLGAKATALALSWGASAERLVFLAPMGGFSFYLDWFARRHGFGPRIRDALHRRLDHRLGFPLLHSDLLHLASSIADPPPLLVVHDPDDPDSPLAGSEQLVSVWPGASLTSTRGLGRLAHYRILRHPPAVRAGVEFAVRAPSTPAAMPETTT